MDLFCPNLAPVKRRRFLYSFEIFGFFLAAGVCLLGGATRSAAADIPRGGMLGVDESYASVPSLYYWETTPVGSTAQLVTLFGRSCQDQPPTAPSAVAQRTGPSAIRCHVPLVSVLRDTLGDTDPRNDRLLYVWLLSYVHPNVTQYMLSAMPFFYWKIGEGSGGAPRSVSPLLNLTTPERSVVSGIGRQILQTGLLDPSVTPLRATSRAYRGNASDYQRLKLEQTATYLRRAPVLPEGGLSQTELDTVVARLELRKRLLGGLVTGKDVVPAGAEVEYAQERTRSRNWEVLRQCAERTGLIFEPLTLAGGPERYGILWFPSGATAPAPGSSLRPIWKLLNLRNPWKDKRLKNWDGPSYLRAFDANGALLPIGSNGVRQQQLIPLGVYSLDYPTAPLLMVDFRGSLHLRRHEMTQRAINDATAGVIGISHFSNWYYYAAADLYNFVVSRHGAATSESARLDCYSQFRASLALDRSLNPALRSQMQSRINSLVFNPLENAPGKALRLSQAHYQMLLARAEDGKLLERISDERRSELADFGESRHARFARIFLHDASLGVYTHRVKPSRENLTALDRERRVLYQLNFLDSLAAAGTAPEVTDSAERIRTSIADLRDLMVSVQARAIRAHVARTLQQLQGISQNAALQLECATALASLQDATDGAVMAAAEKYKKPSIGVAAFVPASRPERAR
jgi:hypothetical protein